VNVYRQTKFCSQSSEFVATFGLMSVIWGCSRLRSGAVPFAVASYITDAYWFTASTSFANPVVTIARCLSDTFAGIQPADVPVFIAAQLFGSLDRDSVISMARPGLASTRGPSVGASYSFEEQ
jgi:glycerol uptake facilitator-like aquaporin